VTIGLIALFGSTVMGLSAGAAIVLGASLAPTDPVLAGDLGVGPPGEEDEAEPNFSITGEAGLNDGLAFPFTLLGIVIAADGAQGSIGEWFAADVLWAIGGGVVIGALVGHGTAAAVHGLRNRRLTSTDLDGFVAIAAILVIYGITEVAGAYGFLAAFAGGLAFRRHERHHELNGRVHSGAEVIEKLAELALVLLVASTVTFAGLGEPGLAGWALVVLAIVVVRPVATALGLLGSGLPRGERRFLGWFGVRGIGSIYYVSAAIGLGVLSDAEALVVFWTVTAAVLVSIVVHGVTATPLGRRWA
jgi:NhaP-type Na+/H+ or K+/H+ antiporter